METTQLKARHDLHLARKIWHTLGVGSMVVIFSSFGLKISILLLGVYGAFFIPLDFLRQTRPRLNQLTLRLFGLVMRKHESHQLSGMTYLIIGGMILLLGNWAGIWNEHIVKLALLFLAIADPVASFFGIRYGRDKIMRNKTLQGTIAAFVTCATIAAIYYYAYNLMLERILIVAPVSGLIGAGAELVPVGKLDDNLTFPVISAILLCLLFHLFGG